MSKPSRPPLATVPLDEVWPPRPRQGRAYMTMSPGQWDTVPAAAYHEGWILLELDDDEQPVAAYRMPDPARK